MITLQVVNNTRGLKAIQRYGSRENVLGFSFRNGPVTDALQSSGFSPFENEHEVDKEFSKAFSAEYIDLIGKMGARVNPDIWWGTWTSSKNRFTSPLMEDLYRLELLFTHEGFRDKELIVADVPEYLRDLIRTECAKRGIPCEVFGPGPIKMRLQAVLERMKYFFEKLVFLVRMAARIIYVRMLLGNRLKDIADRNAHSVVIKTFFYRNSFTDDGGYRDAFFGVLPEYLEKQGKGVLVLGMSQAPLKDVVRGMKRTRTPHLVILESLLRLRDLPAVFLCTGSARISVGDVEFRGFTVGSVFEKLVQRDIRGVDYLIARLHERAATRLVKQVRIETTVLTYENNPWEKFFIMGIRKASPGTGIIGYQHSVVPRSSINMFISDHEKDTIPLPDAVVTVGAVNRDILKTYSRFPPERIIAGPALRYEYLFHIKEPHVGIRGRRVLVGLEGIFEVYHMVNYVLDELWNHTDVDIVIRTHPVLPFEAIRHKIHHDIESYPHVSLSTSSFLKEALEECDVMMYWGSTVGLEALMMGKPIIHFDMGTLLSYDPLFQCSDNKYVARRSTPLYPLLEEIFALDDRALRLQFTAAMRYMERYFYPVSEETLSAFFREEAGQ